MNNGLQMFGASLFFSVEGMGGAVLKRRAKIFRPYTAGNHEGCPYTSAFICVHLRMRIQTPFANTPDRVRDKQETSRGDY